MVGYEEETAPQLARVVDGRYALVRMIGRGAMGAVYEAERLEDSARVAVKIVHPHLSRNEVNAARFAREARVTQHLDHPGIVRTYAAGTDADGSLFLVMELLEGETLRDRLDSGRYTSHHALWIITEVLRALAVAHHAGVVHRDLKPENVFLARTPDGAEVVKLLDFGIARELESVSVTRTETTVGTPSYMAPEQATSAKTVGPAADVWAIGVVLYRLLTGELPFVGDGPYDVVLRVCATPHQPVLELDPSADPALAALVEQCLVKDPRARPADADALLALLAPLVSRPRGLSTLMRHPTPPRPEAIGAAPLAARSSVPPGALLAADLVLTPDALRARDHTPSVEALFASDALSRALKPVRTSRRRVFAVGVLVLATLVSAWGVRALLRAPEGSGPLVEVSPVVEAVRGGPAAMEAASLADDAPSPAGDAPSLGDRAPSLADDAQSLGDGARSTAVDPAEASEPSPRVRARARRVSRAARELEDTPSAADDAPGEASPAPLAETPEIPSRTSPAPLASSPPAPPASSPAPPASSPAPPASSPAPPPTIASPPSASPVAPSASPSPTKRKAPPFVSF